jgi:hypothetical protein
MAKQAYVELVAALLLYIGIASIVLALVGFGRWQHPCEASSIWFQVGMFSWGLGFSCAERILCTFKVLKQRGLIWYDAVWRRMD